MSNTSSCSGAQFVRNLAHHLYTQPYAEPENGLKLISSFRPQGVTAIITHLVGGSTVLYIKGNETPVLMDLAYALPLFGGIAFGGCLRFNRRGKRTDDKSLSYLKAGPSARTVAGIVMNVNAVSFECALPRGLDRHDLRKTNLTVGYGHTIAAPRPDFITNALQLFDRHAPADLGMDREEYYRVICRAFELADILHPTVREEAAQ